VAVLAILVVVLIIKFSATKPPPPIVDQEPAAWNLAMQTNSENGYMVYLNQFPNGAHAEDARSRIHSIGDEREWQNAQSKNSVASYRLYLERYPDGNHSIEAQTAIDNLLKPEYIGNRYIVYKTSGGKEPWLSVRTSPYKSKSNPYGNEIGRIVDGTQVYVKYRGYGENRKWCLIDYNGQDAFVHGNYLQPAY
jgi:hypothetical protein